MTEKFKHAARVKLCIVITRHEVGKEGDRGEDREEWGVDNI
jgi:hypothetical protein